MSCWIRSSSDGSPRRIASGAVSRGARVVMKGRPAARPQAVSQPAAAWAGELQRAVKSTAKQPKKDGTNVASPARPIDTKQLSDTVKEEVKGGESSEGPTSVRLSLVAVEAGADQGRAAGRQGSRRAAAAHAEDLRARVEPDHQGQVRAGPPALLRSPSFARRHGELRNLP